MKSRLQRLIPSYAIFPLIAMAIAQFVTYDLTRLFLIGRDCYVWETAIDLSIPFLPWTITIYVGAFLLWVICILLVLQESREHMYRFFTAHMISSVITMVLFIAVPTTNTRPEFEVNDLFTWGMNLLYTLDPPLNLFPSLHCLDSWLLFLAIKDEEKVPKWFKIFACIFSLMVFVSTMTTKQHVLADVISGWFFAELCYRVLANRRTTAIYKKFFART